MSKHPCVSRRRVLGGAAVVGVGVPVLAACGGDDGGDDAPDAGTVLANTGDVPVGGGLLLSEEQVVITQATAGDFRAFSALCTHQACLVTEVTSSIVCACHGSRFALADGSVENGPATEELPEIPIRVDGDEITAS